MDTKKIDNKEYETCVVCGCTTDVVIDVPVKERKTYILGSGQLCKKCCWEIYRTTDVRNMEEK